VNVSGTTWELIKNRFHCIHRGKIAAKNKGEIDMYFVESELGNTRPIRRPSIAPKPPDPTPSTPIVTAPVPAAKTKKRGNGSRSQ
jgi:hypothetical protein